jgi:NADPH-dependent ferric siderophore reductase
VLPEDAVTRVVVLVDSPADEPELPVPAKGELVFVHRSAGGGEGALSAAVRALDWPAGRVHVFAHGEAQEIMHQLRPYLFGERGLARDQVSVSGYWRRGRTEEGFREWKSDLARREADGPA